MRNRKPPPRPTPAELEILRVLWDRGPSSVREVCAALQGARTPGYTTVLKLLQIMTDKGLVLRDDSQRAHVWRARSRRENTQRQMLADLVDRAFAGSAASLVLQALSHHEASPEELASIRELLAELEGDEK